MLLHVRNILLILAAGLVSCSKIVPFSSSPVITHQSLSYTAELQAADPIFINSPRDTIKMARLNFALTDGDGDIGRADTTASDSLSPGIHLWLYLPVKGMMTPAQDSTIKYLYYQLPEIEEFSATGQIKADVAIEINTYRSTIFPHDIIAYRYYVIDKSGNRSNTLFSEQAVLAR